LSPNTWRIAAVAAERIAAMVADAKLTTMTTDMCGLQQQQQSSLGQQAL